MKIRSITKRKDAVETEEGGQASVLLKIDSSGVRSQGPPQSAMPEDVNFLNKLLKYVQKYLNIRM